MANCRYSSVNEDSPSSYLPTSSYTDSLPTRSSYQATPSTTSSYSPYNSNSSSSSLRQSLSSGRLNNNNNNNNVTSSNGNKYGRLSRHFSFDNDANDTTSSYMSPESYVTLTRHRSRQGDPSVVEKYFSSTMSPSASLSRQASTSTPLSRQASTSTLESFDQTPKLVSYPPRPSPARYVSSLSKSSSSGNANA